MNLNTLLDLAIMIFAGMFCGRTSPTASTSEATMSLEGTLPT